jgi:hypothetical protein
MCAKIKLIVKWPIVSFIEINQVGFEMKPTQGHTLLDQPAVKLMHFTPETYEVSTEITTQTLDC